MSNPIGYSISLKAEVDALTPRVTTAETRLDVVDVSVAAHTGDIASVNTQLNSLGAEMATKAN